MRLSGPNTYLACGVAALAAVAVALVSQYRFGMQPCPWCVLQRLILVFIGLFGLLGWLARPRPIFMASGGLIVALSGCGAAAALYQHFVAAKTASCNMTLADRIVGGLQADTWLPSIFEVRASCADAAAKLLGVPYEFLSLVLFLILGITAILTLRKG